MQPSEYLIWQLQLSYLKPLTSFDYNSMNLFFWVYKNMLTPGTTDTWFSAVCYENFLLHCASFSSNTFRRMHDISLDWFIMLKTRPKNVLTTFVRRVKKLSNLPGSIRLYRNILVLSIDCEIDIFLRYTKLFLSSCIYYKQSLNLNVYWLWYSWAYNETKLSDQWLLKLIIRILLFWVV